MKRNLNSSALLALLLLAIAAGCKKEQPAPPSQPQKAQPAKPAAQAPPVQKQLSSANGAQGGRMDFSRKTDPFKPFVPPAAAPAPAAEAHRKSGVDLLPIQSYEAAKFRVVGIIAGMNENRALVLDPAGKGYVVTEGMQLGSNEGRITRITASSVEVVERYKEDNGRIRKRKIVLPLAKKR